MPEKFQRDLILQPGVARNELRRVRHPIDLVNSERIESSAVAQQVDGIGSWGARFAADATVFRVDSL